MIRKIKAFGLAFVAVFAMSAVVASGASAVNFTSSLGADTGSGGQTTPHRFTLQGQSVTCTEATFTGSLAAPSTQMTINPVYNNCTAFGFIGAKIDMNSCDYLFTAETSDSTSLATGSVHIQCTTPGDSITITAGGCTVHIPPQTPTTNKIDYNNEATGVLVTSTAAGIHSNVTSSFPCTLSSNSTDTSGVYHGSTLFKSTKGGNIHVK